MNSTSQTQNTHSPESLSELRMKVARYANWQTINPNGRVWCIIRHNDGPVDPCSDLNACAEFENGLTVDQKMRYRQKLAANSGKRNTEYISVEDAMCHATAEERCRAFIELQKIITYESVTT